MKIHSSCLFGIVHSAQSRTLPHHLPRYGTLLVIQLVLGVGAVEVHHVEVVVVAPGRQGVTVRGNHCRKLVENRLVLKHLAQLPLQPLVQTNRRYRLLGVADVPDLDCQEISRNHVLALLGKLPRRITPQQLRQEVFLP